MGCTSGRPARAVCACKCSRNGSRTPIHADYGVGRAGCAPRSAILGACGARRYAASETARARASAEASAGRMQRSAWSATFSIARTRSGASPHSCFNRSKVRSTAPRPRYRSHHRFCRGGRAGRGGSPWSTWIALAGRAAPFRRTPLHISSGERPDAVLAVVELAQGRRVNSGPRPGRGLRRSHKPSFYWSQAATPLERSLAEAVDPERFEKSGSFPCRKPLALAHRLANENEKTCKSHTSERSRKPLQAVPSVEGSNPSPSA